MSTYERLIRCDVSAATLEREELRELRRLRRDLVGLTLLESAQRIIAIGALLCIAAHAIIHSHDATTAVVMMGVVLIALASLMLAFRARLGARLVRRDLWLLEEQCRAASSDDGATRGHPYRSTPPIRVGARSRQERRDHRRDGTLGFWTIRRARDFFFFDRSATKDAQRS